METKMLGKITSVNFGLGGYQESAFCLQLQFEDDKGLGIGTTESGGWAYGVIDPNKNSKWTELDRTNSMAELCKKICELLIQAKIHDVYDLKGKPVEVRLEGNALKSWRLLTEVI